MTASSNAMLRVDQESHLGNIPGQRVPENTFQCALAMDEPCGCDFSLEKWVVASLKGGIGAPMPSCEGASQCIDSASTDLQTIEKLFYDGEPLF